MENCWLTELVMTFAQKQEPKTWNERTCIFLHDSHVPVGCTGKETPDSYLSSLKDLLETYGSRSSRGNVWNAYL